MTRDIDPFGAFNAGSTGGYLEGKMLVATHLIKESCFSRSVIYLCAHNAEGAMGIIVNQLLESVSYQDIFQQLEIPDELPGLSLPVHFGGPVDSNRGFVLHSLDYSQTDTLVANRVGLTSNITILKEIANGGGPEKRMLALGYAGWAAGQLEKEIADNSWIIIPPDDNLLFGNDQAAKWQQATKSLGFDPFTLSGSVGHA
jgi:putative transcriptional regulator